MTEDAERNNGKKNVSFDYMYDFNYTPYKYFLVVVIINLTI